MTRNNGLKILGITGGIAAGKSMASARLKKLGGYIFDCDKIAHNVILKGGRAYDSILELIPGGYIKGDGQIDRKKLGDIVFYDASSLALLEEIVHKAVTGVIEKKLARLSRKNCRFIVIDAPLLLKSGLKGICDEIWIIDAPESIRAARLTKRNGLSDNEARHRISINSFEKEISGGKYIIINNDNGLKELYSEIKKRLEIFLAV